MSIPILPNAAARRIFLDRHLLLASNPGSGRGTDLAQLITRLGFVQIDSVNTLARAHDLILWSRQSRYLPEALTDLVGQHRLGFEHWTHDAAVIPMQFYPMWQLKFARDEARMRQRWPKWQSEGCDSQMDKILRHIEAHGPTTSADVAPGEKRSSGGWWDWHPSKVALEFLWRSGKLAVAKRVGFRKVYDLTERVIPAQFCAPAPDQEQVIDWAMTLALERLGFATSRELAAFLDLVSPQEAALWCAQQLHSGQLIEIDVELADGKRHRKFAAPSLMDCLPDLPEPSQRLRLLSPFDPALRDRDRAERLFGFHYRIEIFVPAPKRLYGYYVFPVLQGDRLIGRIDVKRNKDALDVTAFWPETGVRMGTARQKALHAELARIADFTGANTIRWSSDWLRPQQQPRP